MWQDWVLSVGQWVFSAALIPSIIGKSIIPISTSLPTAIVLSVYTFTFYTMNLSNATWSTAVSALCWWILLEKAVLSRDH